MPQGWRLFLGPAVQPVLYTGSGRSGSQGLEGSCSRLAVVSRPVLVGVNLLRHWGLVKIWIVSGLMIYKFESMEKENHTGR